MAVRALDFSSSPVTRAAPRTGRRHEKQEHGAAVRRTAMDRAPNHDSSRVSVGGYRA